MRSLKAREKAESNARNEVEHLNVLMEKWDRRTKKATLLQKEQLKERQYKAHLSEQRRAEVKKKFETKIKSIEERSVEES